MLTLLIDPADGLHFRQRVPSVQISDEPRDPTEVARRLRDGYPDVLDLDDTSRLGRMLARLSEALQAFEVERPGPAAVRTELVGSVPRLRRYAALLTCDPVEADDLVQSTLLKAWERREDLPTGPALAGWLFTGLRRTFLQERRRRSTQRSSQAGGLDAFSDNVTMERRALRDALDRLPPVQREALLLVTIEGLSQEAAAAIIDCPVETVRERLDQGHDRLASDLGPI